jgi:hypothetical protein
MEDGSLKAGWPLSAYLRHPLARPPIMPAGAFRREEAGMRSLSKSSGIVSKLIQQIGQFRHAAYRSNIKLAVFPVSIQNASTLFFLFLANKDVARTK